MKKILIVVDMQNDFIDGSLGTKEAVNILPNVLNKIKRYQKSNIYATRDTHYTNYLLTKEGRNLPIKHCLKNTPGWSINYKLRQYIDDKNIFDKSTFGCLELAKHLDAINKQTPIDIEIIGLCTDICIVSNALLLKAFMPECDITVDSNCCAGVTVDKHNAAIETMKSCQINII